MLLTGLEFTLVVLFLEVLLEVFVGVLLEAEFFTRLVGDTKFVLLLVVLLLVVLLVFALEVLLVLLLEVEFFTRFKGETKFFFFVAMKPLLYAFMLFWSWYR